MNTRSCKAKARRLQNEVAQLIRDTFNLPAEDVKPALMGESGVDIKLSSDAAVAFPFAVECKNQEHLNIWGAIKQAEENSDGNIPLLVFTKNHTDTYCTLKFEDFLGIVATTCGVEMEQENAAMQDMQVIEPNKAGA